MTTEPEFIHPITRRIKASVRRRVLTITGIMGVANIATVLLVWQSLAAEAKNNVRAEAERLSAQYTAREVAAINGSADAVSLRAKALQTENGALQQSLEQAESEMNRLHTALMEKVLNSERIAMAMEDQQRR